MISGVTYRASSGFEVGEVALVEMLIRSSLVSGRVSEVVIPEPTHVVGWFGAAIDVAVVQPRASLRDKRLSGVLAAPPSSSRPPVHWVCGRE